MALRAMLATFLILIHLFFLWDTKDLGQINRDQLFLDKNHFQNFSIFQEKVHDAPLIVMDIKGELPIETIASQIVEKNDFLKSRGISVRTFFDIYQKKVQLDKFSEALEFVKKNPELNFPFLGESHFTMILLLPKEWSWSQSHAIVGELIKLYQFEKFETSFSGTPYINYLLNVKSQAIKTEVFPLIFVLSFVLSFLIIGSFTGAILVFIPSLFSAALTLFISKILFGEMNMITSIIPVLNFILNLTLGYHLYCTFIKERSIKLVLTRKLAPILLMILTTAIGFGSLYFSQIEAISQMSVISSLGLVLSSAVHLLWSYLTYEAVDKKSSLTISKLGEKFVSSVLNKLNAKWIFIIGIITAILGVVFISNIKVMTEAAHYFKDKSNVFEKMEHIHKNRIGNPNFDLIIQLPEDDQDYDHLRNIWKWEEDLKKLAPNHKILSLNQFISEANFLYSGEKKIPDQAMAYSLLRGGIDSELSLSFINESIYRITLTGPFLNNAEYLSINQKINDYLSSNKIPAQTGGLYYTLRMSQNTLIWVLIQSFSLSLFIILVLALIHFRKVSIVFHFALANIIPALSALIVMNISGLTLNVATVMTFSITIGIIVDGSFHIAHAMEKSESEIQLLRESLIPIFMSSAILILSFLVLGFYDFLPIKHFGLTLALNITLGLIFDLKVLPWLLSRKSQVA